LGGIRTTFFRNEVFKEINNQKDLISRYNFKINSHEKVRLDEPGLIKIIKIIKKLEQEMLE